MADKEMIIMGFLSSSLVQTFIRPEAFKFF